MPMYGIERTDGKGADVVVRCGGGGRIEQVAYCVWTIDWNLETTPVRCKACMGTSRVSRQKVKRLRLQVYMERSGICLHRWGGATFFVALHLQSKMYYSPWNSNWVEKISVACTFVTDVRPACVLFLVAHWAPPLINQDKCKTVQVIKNQ